MKKVAIVDYGMGNLDSVVRAVEECGGCPLVTRQAADIAIADAIILPGVGAFADAMQNIRVYHLDDILSEHVLAKQTPFLGICLGMQLLATRGFEGGQTEGLGWIPGEVRQLLPAGEDLRVPHIGWNEVFVVRESPLLLGIDQQSCFYFAHSYHLVPSDDRYIIAKTKYACGFVSVTQHEMIFGVQFHPEKSQRLGFKILRNFLSI